MTTKPREPEPAGVAAPAAPDPKAAETGRAAAPGMCAVDDGTPHYGDGRAIPGTAVCSAHEINYYRDGTRRGV